MKTIGTDSRFVALARGQGKGEMGKGAPTLRFERVETAKAQPSPPITQKTAGSAQP